jgi:hypothetical protein
MQRLGALRMRRIGLALAALAVVVGALWLGLQIANAQTPEQAVARYMDRVLGQDEQGAYRAWTPPGGEQLPAKVNALGQRRDQVTHDLVLSRPSAYRVLGLELWRTCCEPGIAEKPEWAGLVRVKVALDYPDGAREFFFDVRKEPQCCMDDPFDFRPRYWTLRDVYPPTKLPIELPWVYDAAKRDSHPVKWPSEP